jgi:hypothetical protein
MLSRLFRRRRHDEDVVPDLDDASLEGADSLSSLKQFEKMHRLDPNLPLDELDEVEVALNSSNVEKGAEIEQILAEDNSPYPEVSETLSCGPGIPLTDDRFEPRCAISMSTCRRTRYARGR